MSTATPATIHGVRQVIFFVKSGLVSVEPKTGKELWVRKLERRGNADPITYQGRNGKQFVAVATTGTAGKGAGHD